MVNVLEIDHKKMHSVKSAATETGYSRDYISHLARDGKIVAAQINRQWYLDLDSLKQYAHITELEQRVKQKHLSEDRRHERDLQAVLEKKSQRKQQVLHKHAKRVKATMVAFLVLGIGSAASLLHFAPNVYSVVGMQVASAPESGRGTESGDFNFYDSNLIPTVVTTFSDSSVTVTQLADDAEAIVLLPGDGVSDTTLFSDEVEILIANDGSKRIVPIGREITDGLSFVEILIGELKVP